MNPDSLIESANILASPALFALLVGFAGDSGVAVVRASAASEQVKERLEGYLDRVDIIEESEIRRPWWFGRSGRRWSRLLRLLGSLLPKRMVASRQRQLVMAAARSGYRPGLHGAVPAGGDPLAGATCCCSGGTASRDRIAQHAHPRLMGYILLSTGCTGRCGSVSTTSCGRCPTPWI